MSDLWVIPEELGALANSEFAYEACKTASYLLWAMSGRKFSSGGTTTERYSRIPRTESMSFLDWIKETQMNAIVRTNVGPIPSHAIRLKQANVRRIDAIRDVYGNAIDANTYYLSNYASVVFDSPQYNTLDITYTYGATVPTAGRMAARLLAIEFAKWWEGDSSCQLPERVTSFSRQGITATLLDNQDFIEQLRTGFYPVDMFLKTANPTGAVNRTRVFSPDVRRGRKRTNVTTTSGTTGPWVIVPNQRS